VEDDVVTKPLQEEGQVLVERGARPGMFRYLKDIWSRREFAAAIASGEVRSQNMDTVLGNPWHVLNPLLLIAVYYLVFGVILQVDRGVDNYIAFLAVGIFTYHYSQKSISAGAKSITSNIGLIRSMKFPRAILPTATVLGQTFAFIPAIAVMLTVAVVTGEFPHWTWLFLPAFFLIQFCFNIGASCIVARLTDHFHDIENVLPYVLRLAFYLSGVLYSVEARIHDPALLRLFDFNPFYTFITLARGPVMDQAIDVDLLERLGIDGPVDLQDISRTRVTLNLTDLKHVRSRNLKAFLKNHWQRSTQSKA
jgi:teichoic acid transport system permease protein